MDMKLIFEKRNTPLILKSSLKEIGKSHSLRCDVKQNEERFKLLDDFFSEIDYFYLGEFLPNAFIKGNQPIYIEEIEPDGIPVINTLSIQLLEIFPDFCRYIKEEDYEKIPEEKRPQKGDILLTVDGGTSIGKVALFDKDEEFAIDSHVAILRPKGIDPKVLMYLLASPIGQMQFQKAESGASGQTAVTEEDIRRFRFPRIDKNKMTELVEIIDVKTEEIKVIKEKLNKLEDEKWNLFNDWVIQNMCSH